MRPIDEMNAYQVELEIERLNRKGSAMTYAEARRLNDLYGARNVLRRLGR